jgi:hypothetical protein
MQLGNSSLPGMQLGNSSPQVMQPHGNSNEAFPQYRIRPAVPNTWVRTTYVFLFRRQITSVAGLGFCLSRIQIFHPGSGLIKIPDPDQLSKKLSIF